MRLWIKILAGVLPGGAALLLLLSGLVLCCFLSHRRRRDRLNPAAASQLAEAAASKSPKLPKLHMPYKSGSSRASLRFHQLHHPDHRRHHHRCAINQQLQPFRWDEHPRLVADAVENGWSRFSFASAPSRGAGACAACDIGPRRADWPESIWEVPPGSSEFVQTVRLNPAIKKKNGGGGEDSGACAVTSVGMSLPLPGPQLAGSPFPQEAYFEIAILYLSPQSRYSLSARAGGRANNESDKAKLIRQQSGDGGDGGGVDAVSPAQNPQIHDHERSNHKIPVISCGLAICYSPTENSPPGTYPGSVGFHSNGAVYLDGMKLVAESTKSEWAGMNRVIGCGFEPSKKKVFFTVDSQLKHVISCNSDAFASPLYPVLSTDVDVMVSINLGQSKFRYPPANASRTSNPCFDRSASGDGGSMTAGYDDSGELFSMGKVDSGWLENAKSGRSQKSANGGAAADFDAESDLFEISLRD